MTTQINSNKVTRSMKAATIVAESDAELIQQLTDLTKRTGAFKFGHFRLHSGAESDYYFNGKSVAADPIGSSLIAELVYRKIRHLDVEFVGGLASGAILIAEAISLWSGFKDKQIPAFYVRTERKDHGDMSLIEGQLKADSRVVIVDDVATKGTSIIKAIDAVTAQGCKVVKIIVLMDRKEGASEEFERREIPFESILKKEDFILG